MKGVFAALAIVAVSTGALAQSRPALHQMTCSSAAALVQGRGAVVAGTGPSTYERIVSSAGQCRPGEHAIPFFSSTADTAACLVGYNCQDIAEWETND